MALRGPVKRLFVYQRLSSRPAEHKESIFDQVTTAEPKVPLHDLSFHEHARNMKKFRKQTKFRGWVP